MEWNAWTGLQSSPEQAPPPLECLNGRLGTLTFKFPGAKILQVPLPDTRGQEMKTKIMFPAWEEILSWIIYRELSYQLAVNGIQDSPSPGLLLIFPQRKVVILLFFSGWKIDAEFKSLLCVNSKKKKKSLFIARNQHKSNFQKVLIHLVNTNPDRLMHSISLSTIKV